MSGSRSRTGSRRGQQCARPGCGGDVAAWLTYDYQSRTAWLDDAGTEAEGDRWALCAAHAAGLRVPLGWVRRELPTAPADIAV